MVESVLWWTQEWDGLGMLWDVSFQVGEHSSKPIHDEEVFIVCIQVMFPARVPQSGVPPLPYLRGPGWTSLTRRDTPRALSSGWLVRGGWLGTQARVWPPGDRDYNFIKLCSYYPDQMSPWLLDRLQPGVHPCTLWQTDWEWEPECFVSE